MDYMKEAIKEAEKAFKKNEVPVGAIIVKNNKIIAKAYNKQKQKNNITKHAEIIAIDKACKKLKNWRLDDCEIYITLEPCLMCVGAIISSHIAKIYYSQPSYKNGSIEMINKSNINYKLNKEENIVHLEGYEESRLLLENFFKNKRK